MTMHWLKKILTKKYTEEEQDFFEFLRINKIFHSLSDNELDKIKPLLYKRDYVKDEVVFFRKDPSQAVYIMKSGKVNFMLDLDSSEEKIVTVRKGTLFGQNGIIEDTRRNYNAIVTSEKAEIYVIPQQSILELFSKDEQLKAKVMEKYTAYYASYVTKIFSSYRKNLGFFEINQVYKN